MRRTRGHIQKSLRLSLCTAAGLQNTKHHPRTRHLDDTVVCWQIQYTECHSMGSILAHSSPKLDIFYATRAGGATSLWSRWHHYVRGAKRASIPLTFDHSAVTRGSSQNYPVHLAVFYETLRLWPGIPKNARLALRDDVLPAIPDKKLPEVHVHQRDFLLWSDMTMMRSEDVRRTHSIRLI